MKKVHIGTIGCIDHSKHTLKYAIEMVLRESKKDEYIFPVPEILKNENKKVKKLIKK